MSENYPISKDHLVENPCFRPNDVIKWSKLLLHIQEVAGSNLGPETNYPEIFFDFPVSPC
jgi:hypothetical protein